MANDGWATSDSLADMLSKLEQNPTRFDYYSALRWLDCIFPKSPRTGTSQRPGDERVRIGQEPTLIFPPATISSFRQVAPAGKYRLLTFGLGLFGPNGPLPLHLTEYARDRQKQFRDHSLVRFLDVFHHRLASFFYRAWSSGQPTVNLDRPDSDRFALYVGALAGLGQPALRNRDQFPDRGKLFFAAHLACPTRHAEGLVAMVRGFLGLPVQLQEQVGHWMTLPDDCRCRLGTTEAAGRLGITATLGERVWDVQQKFRLICGPLSFESFERLLPTGSSLRPLRDLMRNYVSEELFWDIRLVLKHDEVPQTKLGMAGRLGWTCWLPSRSRRGDAEDLVLQPDRYTHCGPDVAADAGPYPANSSGAFAHGGN